MKTEGTIDSVVGKSFLKKKSYLGEKEREMFYAVQECGTDEWLGAKFLLLYFSAGWCPPCEQFTQTLKDFFHEVNIDQKVIDIIYVSSDKTEAQFKDTYAKMPWNTFKWDTGMH